jgi:hypothetical protein
VLDKRQRGKNTPDNSEDPAKAIENDRTDQEQSKRKTTHEGLKCLIHGIMGTAVFTKAQFKRIVYIYYAL